jgi:hypothetical protein
MGLIFGIKGIQIRKRHYPYHLWQCHLLDHQQHHYELWRFAQSLNKPDISGTIQFERMPGILRKTQTGIYRTPDSRSLYGTWWYSLLLELSEKGAKK